MSHETFIDYILIVSFQQVQCMYACRFLPVAANSLIPSQHSSCLSMGFFAQPDCQQPILSSDAHDMHKPKCSCCTKLSMQAQCTQAKMAILRLTQSICAANADLTYQVAAWGSVRPVVNGDCFCAVQPYFAAWIGHVWSLQPQTLLAYQGSKHQSDTATECW